MNDGDNKCQELADEIADLQAQLTELLREFSEAVGPLEKQAIMRQILEVQRQIASLQVQQRAAGCLPPPPPPVPTSNLEVAGIEATHGIQFFRFNGQGSGSAPNNFVPFVENKTLILRVYVRRQDFPGLPVPSSVTGAVTYAGRPPLPPVNGPVPAQPSAAIDRGNPDSTLNFRIPAAHCTGRVTFSVTVFDPTQPGFPGYSGQTVTFDRVPPVRIHGVLIHYTGRGMDIPALQPVDLINTLAWPTKVYPVSAYTYTAFTTIPFNGDLTVDGGSGCGTGWNDLFNTLWNMRQASGISDVFVGLLPAGVPTSGVIGCGGSGVAISFVGEGQTFAQEIGHAFGRQHAPCGNPGNPDPNYPTYDLYPSGSIGEFGFDYETFRVYNPAYTFDFMSYCWPVWTSPYTFAGLKNSITTSPAVAHPEGPEVRSVVREQLYLNFRMYGDGRVELLESFHLPGPTRISEMGPVSPVSCQLMSEEGGIILSQHCHFTDPHQNLTGTYVDFHEAIPWQGDVRSIVFLRHDEVVHRVDLDAEPPEVGFREVQRVADQEGLAAVEWHGEHADRPVTYLLRYSNDGGNTWQAVAAGLTNERCDVDLDTLPGGDQCRFQIVASTGIRTSTAESEAFAVSVKPRRAYILSPEPDTAVTQGESLAVRGSAYSPDFGTPDFDDMVWTSSPDGLVGVGYEVFTDALSPGRHRITLTVPDGLGEEVSASIVLRVLSPA